MSSVPRLNYFVENESAEAATKNFALILQKAYEQYRKLWKKYLDLVQKYEVDSPIQEENEEAWKKEDILTSTQVLGENVEPFTKSIDQTNLWNKDEKVCDEEQPNSFIEDILGTCTLDFDSDIDDTVCPNQSTNVETKNIVLPESPIFIRKDEQVGCVISKSKSLMDSANKTILDAVEIDNKINSNESEISEKDIDIISPGVIVNSPEANNENNKKKRKKVFKKVFQHKRQSSDNLGTPEKQQMKEQKVPLQTLNSTITPSKTNLSYDANQINNKFCNTKSKSALYYKPHTTSPDGKKLRQTTLPFHKVNKTVLKYTDENVPITKFKQFLFAHKTSMESTVKLNESLEDTTIDSFACANSGNDENGVLHNDIIESSPNITHLQFQNKIRLKSKRKFAETNKVEKAKRLENASETDSAFFSSCYSSKETQNQVCLIKEQNPALDDNKVFLTPAIVTDNVKKKCLKLTRSTTVEDESLKKNNFEETGSIKKQVFKESDPSQFAYEDETFFEENTENEFPSNLANKDAETENQERWSCWECAEYYKDKPGLSETQVKMWKNKCSRHKNVYYARAGTPPGFWDPLFPATASDSIQEN